MVPATTRRLKKKKKRGRWGGEGGAAAGLALRLRKTVYGQNTKDTINSRLRCSG